MPRILGDAVRVVEHDGLSIDEFVGNVSTKEDTLSVAQVKITTPTSEPWLTLHYDEWLCVLSGQMDVHYIGEGDAEQTLTVKGGQTCFVAKGERFRPIFPVGNTEYVPVCSPAFRPDRCIREEGQADSEVTTKLKKLHSGKGEAAHGTSNLDKEKYDSIEKLFHMCNKETWGKAVASQEAYYPPTFKADGNFIHATAVPSKLMEVGNHFYKEDKSEWVCLELSRSALTRKCGIVTVFEEAKPVGETHTAEDWETMLFPHIFGGIPTCVNGIVTNMYPIKRGDDGSFINIVGLMDS